MCSFSDRQIIYRLHKTMRLTTDYIHQPFSFLDTTPWIKKQNKTSNSLCEILTSCKILSRLLKVKVKFKGHVIGTLLWFHENCFFSQANGWNATKLAHDGSQPSLHPGCAQGQGRGQRSRDMGTSVMSGKSLLLAGKWLDRHQTCTQWSPDKPASRVCSRSRKRSKVT